jgi:hypothetical protein
VDTRAYFTAATLISCVVTNLDVIKLTKQNFKLLDKKYPYNNCTTLVPINSPYSLNSTVGSGRITKYIHNITPIHNDHLSVLVGIILTDGWIQLNRSS